MSNSKTNQQKIASNSKTRNQKSIIDFLTQISIYKTFLIFEGN